MVHYINKFNKLFSACKWRIPLAGLVITVGVVGEQAKPVLSNQIESNQIVIVETSTLPVTDLQSRNALLQQRQIQANTNLSQDNSEINSTSKQNLRGKLRDVAAERKLAQPYTESKATQKVSTSVASTNSSKELKTVPTNTALVTEPQGARKNQGVLPSAKFPKQDGIYLYGQSPQPNQVGQGYIVFQKRQNQVTGAMYMPNSEFSCFQGNLDSSGDLAMTVTGFPGEGDQEQVATASTLPKIDADEPMNYAYSVALQDYHQLNSVSANDRRILQMCNQN